MNSALELLVAALLTLGFALGPLKLLGGSWLIYLLPDILTVLILVLTFGERIGNKRPLFAATQLTIPILLLGLFCLLELGNPAAPFIRSVMGLRSWLLYLGMYFVGFYGFRSVAQLKRLYGLLIILGLLTAIYGIFQWKAGPQSFATWSEYYGRYAGLTWATEHGRVFRAFSTFVTPGMFGANMGFLMLVCFGVAASAGMPKWWRICATAAFPIMAAGIAASGSRNPVARFLLAAAIGIALVPGVRSRVKVILGAGAIASLAALVAVWLVGPAIGQRFITIFDPQAFFWKWFGPLSGGIQVAAAHPFGMGLGYTAGIPQFINSPVLQGLPSTVIDSGYGSAAAELGFVGLALFGYFALKVGVESFRAWRSLPPSELRDILLGPAVTGAGLPIVSVISQPQAGLPIAIYYWLLVGVLMKAPALQRQMNADRLPSPQLHAGE